MQTQITMLINSESLLNLNLSSSRTTKKLQKTDKDRPMQQRKHMINMNSTISDGSQRTVILLTR